MSDDHIRIEGARQNNLKNLSLDLPLGELIVITGVSGSGKSSLAFDTVYAEGQRRYVETFSPYARQFLDRMDKPAVDRIEGVLPAIAIDQTNPVRTSRSTVGTMTELNDHLKLLFARAAALYCRGCGAPVRRDTPDTIADALLVTPPRAGTAGQGSPRVLISFRVPVPERFNAAEIKGFLAGQGYERFLREEAALLEVVQDRVRLSRDNRGRLVEALEAALHHGQGRVSVYPVDAGREVDLAGVQHFSAELHCAQCDIDYSDVTPNHFSFNSPVGACETCRGFGRTMGIDYALVVPDVHKTLAGGAIRPWQTQSYREVHDDLLRFAKKRGIPTDVPWKKLTRAQRDWVIDGEGDWDDGVWYGARRFFVWLETKSYKMHIRVLLSKYRSYDECPSCQGARLKPASLLWRLGTHKDAEAVLAPSARFRPAAITLSAKQWQTLPGLTLHDVMRLPIERVRDYFAHLHLPTPLDEATRLLLGEIRVRLDYLCEVGLAYLTLDRQSRTLSGGEVQRINLTTALGTSLVNTLFVLDEPSIGLHPRDMHRVIGVLQRLRDAGNSLLVVEHDPQVMLAADHLIDMGPGPGERGGEVVCFDTPKALLRNRRSLTAQYLCGKKQVEANDADRRGAPDAQTIWLEVQGVCAHNLKQLDVRLPLQRLVCVTGVSGSGKSTLVNDVLYQALTQLKGKPKETPGEHKALRGHQHIEQVVMVDQAPIGRTARSNPASYVGAFSAIRKRYAEEPAAKARGYTAGTFSFNSGTGRCPTCSGSGFEHVEMQFLSDVYLRCPDCDGRRYRPEVLEITHVGAHARIDPSAAQPRSIADVLDMTVSEALAYFADAPDVLQGLAPLQAVGLDYLKLGQPVPTLSGGEAQRLKLAGHLATAATQRKKGAGKSSAHPSQGATLFLFDEPTTGLHFEDIAKLLGAFRQLLAAGHSLIVIEHNIDVMLAADWIIDLGPEGGDGGGEIVVAGTPETVAACKDSHTGTALREYARSLHALNTGAGIRRARKPRRHDKAIRIVNAREHNLKGVDIDIPRDTFTVITGISGSGKSTVAFDILFNEGQRRYLESLNAYARQFVQPASRPEVDAVFGIPPTVAIEQRTSRGGRKSTVATLTEIYHFLRLLFVKLGTQYCPDCDLPIEPQTVAAIVARLMRDYRQREVTVLAPLVVARKGYYTDLARWAGARGFDALRVDGVMLPVDPWARLDRFKEHDIALPVGRVKVTPRNEAVLRALIEQALGHAQGEGKGVVQVLATGKRKPVVFSTKRACPGCGRSFETPDPRLFSYNSRRGWCETCYGTGVVLDGFDAEQTGEEGVWQVDKDDEQAEPIICPACKGQRLNPVALGVRLRDQSIAALNARPVVKVVDFFERLRPQGREGDIARDLLPEIRARLTFLEEVGLGYLSLDRAAPTLSGGEAQRIRLAAQLGSNLRGVCYILDEPTIGLHPRDNRMLLDTLHKLQDKGNTVVVVEHDEDTIRRAEHVIDIGPRAGVHGGEVIAQGSVKKLMRCRASLTGQFLAKPLRHPLFARRRTDPRRDPAIRVYDAHLNNLQHLDAQLPLERLVCITGVSGSGKSTLVREVVHDNLRRLIGRRGRKPKTLRGCKALDGYQSLERVLEVDQTPIGKTPRSCPMTYVGLFDRIRRLFADLPEARLRGYTASRFSYNTRGGRCEGCEGQGVKRIEMSFLPDVTVPCEVCHGARYAPETEEVRYKDKSIGEVLLMSVDEAVDFFSVHPKVHHALKLLQDVGLGYLRLGQPSPTLSGGEAQRIKLVTELAKARPRDMPQRRGQNQGTLYILDEPTVGLHMADVEKLLRVLHRLVTAGNSVIVIEHNLDVMAEADWIIDLGPEGGDAGGRIVAQGTPEQVARRKRGTQTGRLLGEFLAERSA